MCYISEEQTIRGVSAPFQLLSSTDCDVEVSEKSVHSLDQSDGSVIVFRQSSMLKECVQRVENEKVTDSLLILICTALSRKVCIFL